MSEQANVPALEVPVSALRTDFDGRSSTLRVSGAVTGQGALTLQRAIDAAQRGAQQTLVVDVSGARELDGHAVRVLRAVERRGPGQRVVMSLLIGCGTAAEQAMRTADSAAEPPGSWCHTRGERAGLAVSSPRDGVSSWSARSRRPG